MKVSKIVTYIVLGFSLVGVLNCAGYKSNSNGKGKETREGFVRIDDMLLASENLKIKTQAATSIRMYQSTPWINGELPIEFDESYGFTEEEKRKVFDICSLWSARAPVRCVAYTNQSSYIVIKKAESGCWSTVGQSRANGELNLAKDCWINRVIIHELGHAFGLMHEHQRSDRDKYLDVVWENVEDGRQDAFDIIEGEYRTEYDLESVMHYYSWAFSKNWEDTLRLKPAYQHLRYMVGWYEVPSRLDSIGLTQFYTEPQPTPPPPPPRNRDTLESGQGLNVGEELKSENGAYILAFQNDGNLVIYNSGGQPTWFTKMIPNAKSLDMQGDGNLVIYNQSGQPYWATGTTQYPGSHFKIRNDGHAVVETPNGDVVWSNQ